MMRQEANDLITRTGAKDPCGKLMRMYWQPAALVDELAGPRPVKAVKLLGENLVLFRDENDRYGLIDRHCAHRGADLAFGRLENGGLRCAFHGWLFDTSGQCIETPAEAQGLEPLQGYQAAFLSRGREERHPLGLSRRRRAAGVSGDRRLHRARQPYVCVQGPHQLQTGCRRSKSASIRRTLPSCIASSRTRIRRLPTASSSAAPRPGQTCR